jgi:hypothetical protein
MPVSHLPLGLQQQQQRAVAPLPRWKAGEWGEQRPGINNSKIGCTLLPSHPLTLLLLLLLLVQEQITDYYDKEAILQQQQVQVSIVNIII